MVSHLNSELLPPEYFAEFQVHVGRLEIDVATFEGDASSREPRTASRTATLSPKTWMPPAPTQSLRAAFPDSVEVLVFRSTAGPTLVAAIELVSPGNKDRDALRRAFAIKCASYLQRGVGLVIVDVVTNRSGNLHEELLELLGTPRSEKSPAAPSIYATAYRPRRGPDEDPPNPAAGFVDVWVESLSVGVALPTLPLALDRGIAVPLDLELTYEEARRRSRLS